MGSETGHHTKNRLRLVAAVFSILFLAACGNETDPGRERSEGPLPLLFYTSISATCPQMPLLSAQKSGALSPVCTLDIKLWKNQDDLRGVLLAGQGDIWLGSTETFARAAKLGAPITLLAITGWRKFYLVSRDPARQGFEDFAGRNLHYAPVAAPVGSLLHSLETAGLPGLRLLGVEPRQLGLMLLRGQVDSAVLPEPQVSVLMEKDSRLRVLTGVAELAGRLTGSPPRIPWAGLAVHTRLIREHPGKVGRLVEILVDEGHVLAGDPERGISSLPAEIVAAVGRDLIRRSIERDLILVEPADDVRGEIVAHLRLTAPDLFDESGRLTLPDAFIRRP